MTATTTPPHLAESIRITDAKTKSLREVVEQRQAEIATIHPTHEVYEEGILVSDPACALCRATVKEGAALLALECAGSSATTTPAIEQAEIERLSELLGRSDLHRTIYARALEKMRRALVNVHDGMEDEGDRIYLSSTNHADDLKDAWHLADALRWDEVMEHTQPKTDLAAVNLELQAELARQRQAFEAREARLREVLEKHLEWIDKERSGPDYGGLTRVTHPEGEAIWRRWWDEQLDLCADTERLCRAALGDGK